MCADTSSWWYSAPIRVHAPEHGLREGVPLCGSQTVQRAASVSSCGTPSPIAYLTPKPSLRLGVPLRGGQAVPTRGFTVVLWDAFALRVHEPEEELRHGLLVQ